MAQQRRLFVSPERFTPPSPDPRFGADLPPNGAPWPELPLDAEEAHYARDVLRLVDGEGVTLLDGTGQTADAVLRLAGRKGPASVEVLGPWTAHPNLQAACELVLLVPLPKGERADWMVEKLAELGCIELVFVHCARSMGANAKQAEKRLERLARVARAAARQARHGRVPRLTATCEVPLAQALAAWQPDPGRLGWVADLAADLPPWTQALAGAGAGQTGRRQHVMVLGPEGGLTPDELNQARGFGYTPTGLGPHVLRVETAAVAAAAVACQTAP